jgi:phospholipid/cholesterol/gamma-HCH transport system ATP-binding protein
MEEVQPQEPVIEINGLYKSFGTLEVLRGVDLTVRKGENVAVLGKSGSGKSVLIKMLVGLLKPDRGQVKVFGSEVDTLGRKALDQLRLRIGFSFQSSALYDSMDVYQNLAFPLTMNVKGLTRKQVDDSVAEALEAVGLADKARQMPPDLSGGQRKRIGIARTLILKPEIMLYDEPTSGLDPITSAEINALINQVQEQYHTTSIIITHDLTCAKNTCNRLAMLVEGRFLRTGTFAEVFAPGDDQVHDFFTYNFIQ